MGLSESVAKTWEDQRIRDARTGGITKAWADPKVKALRFTRTARKLAMLAFPSSGIVRLLDQAVKQMQAEIPKED